MTRHIKAEEGNQPVAQNLRSRDQNKKMKTKRSKTEKGQRKGYSCKPKFAALCCIVRPPAQKTNAWRNRVEDGSQRLEQRGEDKAIREKLFWKKTVIGLSDG